MDIGSRIHELRLAEGFTIKELANRTGVSPAFISSVEHHQCNISFEKLERICEVLEISLAGFFSEVLDPLEEEIAYRVHHMNAEQKQALYHFLTTIT